MKVKVDSGEGGYVFPSKITGTESGGEAGLPFNLSFELDQEGSCTASSSCDYTETSITGTAYEIDDTCDMTFPIDQSGASLAGYESGLQPDLGGVVRLSFVAKTEAYTYPNTIGCYVALDWGLQHTAGDGYTSNDVWTPGATSLSVAYDDPGVETGTIDFTFSY